MIMCHILLAFLCWINKLCLFYLNEESVATAESTQVPLRRNSVFLLRYTSGFQMKAVALILVLLLSVLVINESEAMRRWCYRKCMKRCLKKRPYLFCIKICTWNCRGRGKRDVSKPEFIWEIGAYIYAKTNKQIYHYDVVILTQTKPRFSVL